MSSLRGEVFNKGVGFKVGNGLVSCLIWVDDCLGAGPLSVSFSRLFRVVFNKNASVKDYYIPNGNGVSWKCPSGDFYAHMKWLSISLCSVFYLTLLFVGKKRRAAF